MALPVAGERQNLVAEEGGELADRAGAKTRDALAELERLRALRTSAPAADEAPPEDVLKELGELGYVDDGCASPARRILGLHSPGTVMGRPLTYSRSP